MKQDTPKEESIIVKLLREIPEKEQDATTIKMLTEVLEAQDKELQSLRDQLAAKENLLDAYRTDNKKLTEYVFAWDKDLKEAKQELQQRDETIKELKEALTFCYINLLECMKKQNLFFELEDGEKLSKARKLTTTQKDTSNRT